MGVPGRLVSSSVAVVMVVIVAAVLLLLLTGATAAGVGADVADVATGSCAGFVIGRGRAPCGGEGLAFSETDSICVSWSVLSSVIFRVDVNAVVC